MFIINHIYNFVVKGPKKYSISKQKAMKSADTKSPKRLQNCFFLKVSLVRVLNFESAG